MTPEHKLAMITELVQDRFRKREAIADQVEEAVNSRDWGAAGHLYDDMAALDGDYFGAIEQVLA